MKRNLGLAPHPGLSQGISHCSTSLGLIPVLMPRPRHRLKSQLPLLPGEHHAPSVSSLLPKASHKSHVDLSSLGSGSMG